MPENGGGMISHEVVMGEQRFRVRIKPEQQAWFERIARFTQATFQDVSSQTLTAGAQAWSMTAFQIAQELFKLHEQLLETEEEMGQSQEREERIERMIRRIEEVQKS